MLFYVLLSSSTIAFNYMVLIILLHILFPWLNTCCLSILTSSSIMFFFYWVLWLFACENLFFSQSYIYLSFLPEYQPACCLICSSIYLITTSLHYYIYWVLWFVNFIYFFALYVCCVTKYLSILLFFIHILINEYLTSIHHQSFIVFMCNVIFII